MQPETARTQPRALGDATVLAIVGMFVALFLGGFTYSAAQRDALEHRIRDLEVANALQEKHMAALSSARPLYPRTWRPR